MLSTYKNTSVLSTPKSPYFVFNGVLLRMRGRIRVLNITP